MSQKERRQRYRCRRFVEVKDIPTWADYSKTLQIDSKKYPPKTTPNPEINSKIALYHGDSNSNFKHSSDHLVTEVEVDAVVNAANSSCLGGGGIE